MNNVRVMVLNDAYKSVEKMQGCLKLTDHFIARINARSPDQQRSFLFFTKCLAHALKNVDKLMMKIVAYKSPHDTIVIRLRDVPDEVKAYQGDKKFQVVMMTYFQTMNPDRHLVADIEYAIPR